MWNRYFIPDMDSRINYMYIYIGGDSFMVRNPPRKGNVYKYMEEIRAWQRKAERMVNLMSLDLPPLVLK